MQPYVSLTEMSIFQEKSFICGSTNALFETKADWFDVLGSFSNGIVKPSTMRLSSQDRQFIHNVLNGMGGKNEQWVRTQFRNYTRFAFHFSKFLSLFLLYVFSKFLFLLSIIGRFWKE